MNKAIILILALGVVQRIQMDAKSHENLKCRQ